MDIWAAPCVLFAADLFAVLFCGVVLCAVFSSRVLSWATCLVLFAGCCVDYFQHSAPTPRNATIEPRIRPAGVVG
jgi:hypothetical protein